MEGSKSLSNDQIRNLLSSTRAPKGISTEPREITIWFKQDHFLRPDGCSNPNCKDPRPLSDTGRQIVIKLKEQYCCRYCFLDGWLSDSAS